MMKKLSFLFILTLLIVALVGCSTGSDLPAPSNNNEPNPSGDSQLVEYGVAGNITEITISEDGSILGTIMVEGPENNGAQYDKAVVTVTPDTKIYISEIIDFSELEVGMYVNVFFDGPVRESYPVQADAKQINVVPDEVSSDDNDEK